MFTLSACGGWFEGAAPEKVRAAKANGFDALEILSWKDMDLAATASALKETGTTISAILIQSKDAEKQALIANTHGIVWADAHQAFVDALGETLEAAKALNVTKIVVTTGNERSDVSRGYQHDMVVKALKLGADVVKGSGVDIVLEPLNVLVNHAGYFLVTTAETAEIIREVDRPEVKILFDVYHQQISEGNVIRNIVNHIDLIGHIHVGDNPGRNEPGTGEINYRKVFEAIAKAGYQGYVVFECGHTEETPIVCRKMLALAEGL